MHYLLLHKNLQQSLVTLNHTQFTHGFSWSGLHMWIMIKEGSQLKVQMEKNFLSHSVDCCQESISCPRYELTGEFYHHFTNSLKSRKEEKKETEGEEKKAKEEIQLHYNITRKENYKPIGHTKQRQIISKRALK